MYHILTKRVMSTIMEMFFLLLSPNQFGCHANVYEVSTAETEMEENISKIDIQGCLCLKVLLILYKARIIRQVKLKTVPIFKLLKCYLSSLTLEKIL